jgi:cephalosporin hydroxylase
MNQVNFEVRGDELILQESTGPRSLPIGSPEAFEILSRLWLRSGWDAKYVYSFTWMGRPIIQLPEDLIRLQELLYQVRPSVVVETGVAHGGSLVFYASLLQAMGSGRVVGVDIEIRPHNRRAIEEHPLASCIHLIEGSSIEEETVKQVRSQLKPDDHVMVILDSNHSRDHVLKELQHYAPMVSLNSFIVVCDGIMQDLVGAPRSQPDWAENNPQVAVKDFLAHSQGFELVEPPFQFNEGSVRSRITYWPNCFLKRVF